MSHVLHSDPSNACLSPSKKREKMGAVIVTGNENMAATLDFALYHLVKYLKAYAKVRNEVRERFTWESDFKISTVAELTYLSAVLTEAMTITPAAPLSQLWVVPRRELSFWVTKFLAGCVTSGSSNAHRN